MSAATVAQRLSSDPTCQEEIARLLEAHGFSDREHEGVLLLTDFGLECLADAGVVIGEAVVLRVGVRALDTIWVHRSDARGGRR